ncbi:MAG: DUF4861 family protein [Candidatus Latescibacterota bacterium]
MKVIKIVGLTILCIGLIQELALAQKTGWYTEGEFKPVKRIVFTITNHLGSDWKECPVIIKRDQLPTPNIAERYLTVVDPSLPSFQEPTKEQLREKSGYLFRAEENGHIVEYQQDDLDKDGIWDELFFLTDIKAHETKTMFLYIGYSERGLFEHKTHAGMGYYGRHMVPFWESEYIAWKLWFPTSVDMHGKRKPMLTGYYEYTNNLSGYYMPYEYGSDIMTVSNTFGDGGIGLFENPSLPDSVSVPRYSPFVDKGPYIDTRYAYEVVANGPLRSMIRVKTMNWKTGKGIYETDQLYTAVAKKSWSTCRVKFTEFWPEEPSTAFVCGIRHIMNENETYQSGGVVMSFGKNVVIRASIDSVNVQGLTLDFEGIALVVKDSLKPVYRDIKGFGGNHVFLVPATPDRTFDYMIFGAWSEGSVNTTANEFKKYVATEAERYNNPLTFGAFIFEEKQK